MELLNFTHRFYDLTVPLITTATPSFGSPLHLWRGAGGEVSFSPKASHRVHQCSFNSLETYCNQCNGNR